MSEPCEFEFVPRKRAVRDLVAQIGNHTSKSEASIQSETALNAGETENLVTDQIEARHQREHKDVRYSWATRTSSRRRLQFQEGTELRKYWRDANHCFSTAILFKLQDWCSTRPWIPHSTARRRLTKLVMDLVKGCSPDAHRGLDTCTETIDMYTEIRCRFGDTRNRKRQLSVLIVNIETDAQTE